MTNDIAAKGQKPMDFPDPRKPGRNTAILPLCFCHIDVTSTDA
jgi:hypothetical protein